MDRFIGINSMYDYDFFGNLKSSMDRFIGSADMQHIKVSAI